MRLDQPDGRYECETKSMLEVVVDKAVSGSSRRGSEGILDTINESLGKSTFFRSKVTFDEAVKC